jgi:hypothetical protein
MRIVRITALLVALAAPAAASEALEAEARTRLATALKDPFSAEFLDLYENHKFGMRIICGKVNAKNAYGAYVGFKPIAITPDQVIMVDSSDHAIAKAFGDVINHLCSTQP